MQIQGNAIGGKDGKGGTTVKAMTRLYANASTTGTRAIGLEYVPDFILVNYVENTDTYTSIFYMYDSNESTTQYRDYQYGSSEQSLKAFDSKFTLTGNVLNISNSSFGKGNTANSHCMIAYGKY